VQLRFGAAAAANGFANFDLNAGTIGTIGAGLSAASITPAGNGWYRCTITGTTTAAVGSNLGFYVVTDATASNGQSNTLNTSLFLYGAQIEVGSFATSYIPTVASTVTRDPDTAVMTGADFTSWYNYNEGSIAVTASSFRGTAGGARNFQFDNGTNEYVIGTFGDILLFLNDDAVPFSIEITPTPPVPLDGTVYKFASAWKANDFASVTTGAVGTNTGAPMPSNISQLLLGSATGGGNLNGHLRNIVYYSTRLTNTQLRALWT
jgi:hypothetical protein